MSVKSAAGKSARSAVSVRLRPLCSTNMRSARRVITYAWRTGHSVDDRHLVRLQSNEGRRAMSTKKTPLTPELLHKMDAYWRAGEYLFVRENYLYDKPHLQESLQFEDLQPQLLGALGN